MTQLSIDIAAATVSVLKAQKTLAGNAVESDRVDGVAALDMPRLIIYWREEGNDLTAGSGPPAFDMNLTLVVQALVERATPEDARADLDTLLVQCQIALLEDPVWNRMPATVSSMRVSRVFKGTQQLVEAEGRIEFVLTWRQRYETRIPGVLTGIDLQIDLGSPTDRLGDYGNTEFPIPPAPRTGGPDGRIEIAVKIDLPVE